MCGRYRLARKKEILAEYFDVENDVDWSPRYNVAPGQDYDDQFCRAISMMLPKL